MNKMRKILMSVMLVLTAAVLLQFLPVQASAATKSGLVKVANQNEDTNYEIPYYYYYYSNGVKVKNTWKTVNGYKYYFSSTGKAYCAPTYDDVKYNVIFKTIGSYKYCFNNKGQMVTSGYYQNADTENIFYVDSKGHYNYTKTMAIRKTIGYLKNASALRKILGNPSKTEDSATCSPDPKGDGSIKITKDRVLTYKHFYVSLGVTKAGKEYIWGIFPR